VLEWRPDADRDALLLLDRHLTRAVELNDHLAPAYAYLAEVKAALDPHAETAVAAARQAIALDGKEPAHHLAAARVWLGRGNYDDARREVQTALDLARTARDREAATEVLKAIDAAAKRPAALG